jgi:glycerate kinase
MRVLIACDSFKDALPADGVCHAIAMGFLHQHPGATVTKMPLSDGGEGVLDILRRKLDLKPFTLEVSDPLGRPIQASYGISGDGATALVEMAEASGLQRLTLAERNPLLASTYGTGQLLADAKARGAKRVLLAIGGSATTDAGIGAAAALGWQFLDANGKNVKPEGGRLQDIARIVAPKEMPFEQVDVLCDVTNPLFGPSGAAWVYGRQKGGTDESLTHLDAGLRHIAALVEKETGRKGLADIPGAGAAGGLGFGALAFMNATLKRGIEMVLDLVGFDAEVASADLVITGEGHIDGQSGQGKLIQGVCARAGTVPVVALCGKLSAGPEQIKAIGLKAAYSINDVERPLAEMLAATAVNLEKAAARIPLPVVDQTV